MRPGSLVVLIKPISSAAKDWNYICPILNKIYTVREIKNKPLGLGILLEEIVNKPIPVINSKGIIYMDEWPFLMNRFKEILPPINIEEEIKQELVHVI